MDRKFEPHMFPRHPPRTCTQDLHEDLPDMSTLDRLAICRGFRPKHEHCNACHECINCAFVLLKRPHVLPYTATIYPPSASMSKRPAWDALPKTPRPDGTVQTEAEFEANKWRFTPYRAARCMAASGLLAVPSDVPDGSIRAVGNIRAARCMAASGLLETSETPDGPDGLLGSSETPDGPDGQLGTSETPDSPDGLGTSETADASKFKSAWKQLSGLSRSSQ